MNASAGLFLLLLLAMGRGRGHVQRLNVAQLRQLALMAGFAGQSADVAAAVAMAESGGDPAAEGDLTLGISRGLWQINVRAHPDFDAVRLFDPEYNARAAYLVSSHGTSWTPWTNYRNGAYKKYMPGGGNA